MNEPIQRDPITRSSGDNVPPPGPGREPSAEEEAGVEATDTEARTPLGVGVSMTRRGEDFVKKVGKEAGRTGHGTTGKAERPTGKSHPRDRTSINAQESLDEGTPD